MKNHSFFNDSYNFTVVFIRPVIHPATAPPPIGMAQSEK
jgi:hypothetical protein